MKRVGRSRVIKERVNKLSEEEAKFLLAQMIVLNSDVLFGDPSYQEMDGFMKKMYMSLLLCPYGISESVSE